MVRLNDIFNIKYGNGLAFSSLIPAADGINFVSRQAKNNGVAGKVSLVDGLNAFESGSITVAVSGSILESFVQPEPFYTAYHVLVLTPKSNMSLQEKLYYCMCIRANKYKYSYGRQANKTLKDIMLPGKDEIPSWVHSTPIPDFSDIQKPVLAQPVPDLKVNGWKAFRYDELFDIQRGLGPRKKDLQEIGTLPFISSINKNNGVACFCNAEPTHNGNVITVNRNGSVGEAFYQTEPFCTTEDVHVFNPKFPMNPYIALFLCALIRKEKFRYNYGRKWGLERMNQSIMKLPVDSTDNPNWEFIETYVKTLKYSSNL